MNARNSALLGLALMGPASASEDTLELQTVKQCLLENGKGETHELELMYQDTRDAHRLIWSYPVQADKPETRDLSLDLQTLKLGQSKNRVSHLMKDSSSDGTLDPSMSGMQAKYEEALRETAAICRKPKKEPDFMCAGHVSSLEPDELQSKYRQWRDSSVLVFKKDAKSFCSGVVIQDQSILTAAHCVNNRGSQIQVAWYRNEEEVYVTDATLILRSNLSDIAVLSLPSNATMPALKVATEQDEPGEWTYTLGHPYGRAWTLMTQPPFLNTDESSIDATPGRPLCWGPGVSGGPILSSEGAVVGIAIAQDPTSAFITNLSTINTFLTNAPAMEPAEGEVKVCPMVKNLVGLTPQGAIYSRDIDLTNCSTTAKAY